MALGFKDFGGTVGAIAIDNYVQYVRVCLTPYRGDGTAQAFDIVAGDGDDGYLHLLSGFVAVKAVIVITPEATELFHSVGGKVILCMM